jgi:hypothetical protein
VWIVYYRDVDPEVGEYLAHRKFDDEQRAIEFCDRVDGWIETKSAFA